MNTAHRIPRIGLARATGIHLQAVNEPLQLPLPPAPSMPRRVDSEPEAVHQARLRAVRRLGADWVLHPDYTFQARHSTNPEVYGPARAEYLRRVAQLAAAARTRNPAWHAAQRVRAALAHQEA